MLKLIMKRPVWQFAVLFVVLVFGLLHTIDNVYPSPHSLCPFGGLATLYSLLETGEFIHRVHSSAVFLLLAVILTAVLAGRAFCGRLCPFGTVNEWLYRAGRKAGLKERPVIPERFHHKLKYLKYVVLILLLYYTWTAGKLVYRAWCPWSAFMTVFDPLEIIDDILMGGVILVILLALSVFVERFFCKYLCPLGAAIAIFNRFSLIKPERQDSCIQCGVCDRACPAKIKISQTRVVTDSECIHCYRCIEACPDQKSMSFNFAHLRPHVAALLVLIVFSATVAYSVAGGYWERGRLLHPSSGQAYAIEGVADSLHDIKASTSLAEISDKTGIPIDKIYDASRIPQELPPETTLREISDRVGYTRRDILLLLHEMLSQEVDDGY